MADVVGMEDRPQVVLGHAGRELRVHAVHRQFAGMDRTAHRLDVVRPLDRAGKLGHLLALTGLNVAAVILTVSRFDIWFFITAILNVALALALRQMITLGRILTLVRCLLGIALALVVAVPQGAVLDAAVTFLLLAGIALPILGPPHRVKSLVGVGLFVLGCIATAGALLASRVVVG